MELVLGKAAGFENQIYPDAHGSQQHVLRTQAFLQAMITRVFAKDVAVMSSFGAEAAVLLHLVAEVSVNVPVLFLDTGKHFPETIKYRDELIAALGLSNVQIISPRLEDLNSHDPQGDLWRNDPEACCNLRKVRPLELFRSLPDSGNYTAWITGRKSFQSTGRAPLAPLEWDGGHVKINPLANWSIDQVSDYFERHHLKRHPMVASGFPSIGCAPCTSSVGVGEDMRAGRWRGNSKSECGVHRSPSSSAVSATAVEGEP